MNRFGTAALRACCTALLPVLAVLLCSGIAHAEAAVSIDLGSAGPSQVSAGLKMLLLLTALAVTPALLMSATSFLRIIVVLSFLRSAMGTQSLPPQQILVGLALFLTVAIMSPIGASVWDNALEPYLDGEMAASEAIATGSAPLRDFMLRQTREADLALFYDINQAPHPDSAEDVNLRQLIPAFIISELRTSFEMGFMLFAPFLVLDLVVASILMAMGMVMLPPAMISLPLKIMLFVLADGWNLLVGSLVRSFT